jgi:hypothetical protein
MMLFLVPDPFEILGVFAGMGLLMFGGYAAVILLKWMSRRLSPPDVAPDQLAELNDRLARLEESELRLAEVEERLEFAERVLATEGKVPAALPRNGEG